MDVNDSAVNDYFEPEDIRIPFRNMIYIGDSDTDIPCMKLINANSGHSIGVFNPETKDKRKVYKMMEDKRIKYFAPADYTKDSELDRLVKAIIDQTASNEKLMSLHYQNKKEQANQNVNMVSLENVFSPTLTLQRKISLFSMFFVSETADNQFCVCR